MPKSSVVENTNWRAGASASFNARIMPAFLFCIGACAGCERAKPASKPEPVTTRAALNASVNEVRDAPPPKRAERDASARAGGSAALIDSGSNAPGLVLDASRTSAEEPPTVELTRAAQVPLVDERGIPLPQTDARPSSNSAGFRARMQLLVRAIAQDDPSIAEPSFFPLVAYEQVKAIAKPERDYRSRLMKAFARDIRETHVRLGDSAERIEFESVELPEDRARFMEPGSEGNKLGYFRVLGSKLRYRDARGAVRALSIASLISWRGEWYVVHLSGFR